MRRANTLFGTEATNLTESAPVTALVVAHPGHELRVHAWMERARPQVFILTDGSGHSDHGRLESSAVVIERVGASRGTLFGRFSDREAYRLILEVRVDSCTDLVLELTEAFEAMRVEFVVSDAVEGFNPVHDLCNVITTEAVRIASKRLDRPIQHYDFLLEAAPKEFGAKVDLRNLEIELDDAAWNRKMAAAWDYGMLRSEVERSIDSHGLDAFRLEVMRPVEHELANVVTEPVAYEAYGKQQVAAGIYEKVLRFRSHFVPLAQAIRGWAKEQ